MKAAIARWTARMLVATSLVATGLAAQAQENANPPLPVQRITAGMHVIQAEMATTPGERMLGLMNRDSLAPNGGMLFVFEEAGRHCFWMRNTRIPLSIAFVDEDGTIVNIADMEPFDESGDHCPARPVRHALEMAQGWFAQRGIREGARLKAPGVFVVPGSPARSAPR